MEDVNLTRREHELTEECTRWRVRNAEIRRHLFQARVHSCIHPYLNHTALIPNQDRPETMRTGGVTLATAISDTHERNLRWHAMPQYHDDDGQASRSSKPTPFPTTAISANNSNPSTPSGIVLLTRTVTTAVDETTSARTATTPTPSVLPSQSAWFHLLIATPCLGWHIDALRPISILATMLMTGGTTVRILPTMTTIGRPDAWKHPAREGVMS